MDAKVTWNGDMRFTGTATSGFTIPIGTRNEDGSYTTGTSPLELLAIGLVSGEAYESAATCQLRSSRR